jgi:hypothetical protein
VTPLASYSTTDFAATSDPVRRRRPLHLADAVLRRWLELPARAKPIRDRRRPTAPPAQRPDLLGPAPSTLASTAPNPNRTPQPAVGSNFLLLSVETSAPAYSSPESHSARSPPARRSTSATPPSTSATPTADT